MTAYWVQNWQIANKVPFASRAQVQAVRGQVARALGASPAFARMGDAATGDGGDLHAQLRRAGLGVFGCGAA
jgi:hypothetical protein